MRPLPTRGGRPLVPIGARGYHPRVPFQSGSAYAMVRDIAEGYLLVTERTFRMLTATEVDLVNFELDRHVRELRGDQPALDDIPAIQVRNRKIQRLNSAAAILRSVRQRMRS
jgi:hypothetical protein